MVDCSAHFPEDLLYNCLNREPKREEILLVWAESVTGKLIAQLNNLPSKRLALIINEKSPSLRRAEMLINSNIDRICSYCGNPVTTDALFTICKNTLSNPKKKAGNSIRRILKLTETAQQSPEKHFQCLFAEGVLIEHSSNATVASLQLKGHRASALYLGNLTPDYLAELDKIIPHDMGHQVLMNQNRMSQDEKKRIEGYSKKFKTIDSSNQQSLIHACAKMELPDLHKSVWKGPEAMLNTKINLILKKEEFAKQIFCLQGFDKEKSEPHLSLEVAGNVVDSTDPSHRPKLLHYKKEITQKQFIILNSKTRGIHEELLRLLYCVSQIPHVIIAVGPQKNFRHLLETAEAYEGNPFYSHRSVHLVFALREKLPLMIKELMQSARFMHEDEDLFTFGIGPAFNMVQSACDILFGKIQSEYPKLIQAVDLGESSGKIITQNLAVKQPDLKNPDRLFTQTEKRKALHTYLKHITPSSSKTTFPNTIDELVKIIKSLIFLIMEKPKNKLTPNDDLLNYIDTTKLTLTPLAAYFSDFEALMTQIDAASSHVPENKLKETAIELIEKSKHLEFIIQQVELQYSFLQLATPNPELFMNFSPDKLHNIELLAKKSPFQEISLLIKQLRRPAKQEKRVPS
jgi:hypothetical protein